MAITSSMLDRRLYQWQMRVGATIMSLTGWFCGGCVRGGDTVQGLRSRGGLGLRSRGGLRG